MKPANVYSIDTEEQFKDLIQHVEEGHFKFFCLDLETDSKQEKLANIYGIGMAFQDDEAFYVPIRRKDTTRVWDEYFEKYIYEYVVYWCKKYKLIGWNLIYDTLVLEYNSGHAVSDYIYSDGILLKHMVDEERPFKLKEVAVKYLGEDSDKAQQAMIENIKANGGEATQENMEMWKCDTDVLADYCGWDVILSYRLFELFEERLYKEGLDKLFYEEEVMPLYREVTIPAKRNGFPIDVAHFENLEVEIKKDIVKLEEEIYEEIEYLVDPFEQELLDKDYPIKRAGGFPKALASMMGIKLPEKNGKTTLAKKELLKSLDAAHDSVDNVVYHWILDTPEKTGELEHSVLIDAQSYWFHKDNPDRTTIFNLKSNDHLGWLLFDRLREKPLGKTPGGKPQIDDEMIESLIGKYPFVEKLSILKKLNKLHSTYIEGILSRHIKGIIYTSLLQFGTTGGRYSSTNPNLQNLPRVKGEDSESHPLVLKYANAIREGFVSPKGYKIVDADESALEPRAFAHCSSDVNLQNIFHTGEDMYSAIAKRMFGLTDCSTFKKDANFLGTLYPEKRQLLKTMALAVTYGAEAPRIADLLGIPIKEAQQLIDDYLNAYSGLKGYIEQCHTSAKTTGTVRTIFGRTRHLPHAKRLYAVHGDKLLDYRYAKFKDLMPERRIFKNALNNSTNMPIQGLAAHVINRASINISREFKKHNIDGYIALQIHDQICCIVKEEQAEQALDIVQYAMENSVSLSVPLVAEPKIADNLRDSH